MQNINPKHFTLIYIYNIYSTTNMVLMIKSMVQKMSTILLDYFEINTTWAHKLAVCIGILYQDANCKSRKLIGEKKPSWNYEMIS